MLDEQDADAFCPESADDAAESLRQRRADAGGWLVKQDQRRVKPEHLG